MHDNLDSYIETEPGSSSMLADLHSSEHRTHYIEMSAAFTPSSLAVHII